MEPFFFLCRVFLDSHKGPIWKIRKRVLYKNRVIQQENIFSLKIFQNTWRFFFWRANRALRWLIAINNGSESNGETVNGIYHIYEFEKSIFYPGKNICSKWEEKRMKESIAIFILCYKTGLMFRDNWENLTVGRFDLSFFLRKWKVFFILEKLGCG